MKRNLKIFLLLITLVSLVACQKGVLCRGKVYDKEGVLIGVEVLKKGSSAAAAVADYDGVFILKGIEKGDTLVFNYPGYYSKEIVYLGEEMKVLLEGDSTPIAPAPYPCFSDSLITSHPCAPALDVSKLVSKLNTISRPKCLDSLTRQRK